MAVGTRGDYPCSAKSLSLKPPTVLTDRRPGQGMGNSLLSKRKFTKTCFPLPAKGNVRTEYKMRSVLQL